MINEVAKQENNANEAAKHENNVQWSCQPQKQWEMGC
jgi:hypothetical protein